MKTKRLSKKVEDILNHQVLKEANAAQIYLSYGTWADEEGYAGVANLLFRHSQEERNHMTKVIEYIQSRGGRAKISALSAPPKDPKSLLECFENIFKHEVDNSKAIYEIVNLALEEKDWATYNFGQWFVKEQIEEETLVMDILDMLKIAGGDKASDESLLYFDNKMGAMDDEAELAREVSATAP